MAPSRRRTGGLSRPQRSSLRRIIRSRRPASELRRLSDWVMLLSDLDGDVPLKLIVVDSMREGLTTGGMARVAPDRNGKATFSVEIFLSRGVRFPYLNKHNRIDDVGQVLLRSWEEEFIFVLAHEIRHVEQFLAGVYSREHSDAMESDADRFGVWALEKFRRYRLECRG